MGTLRASYQVGTFRGYSSFRFTIDCLSANWLSRSRYSQVQMSQTQESQLQFPLPYLPQGSLGKGFRRPCHPELVKARHCHPWDPHLLICKVREKATRDPVVSIIPDFAGSGTWKLSLTSHGDLVMTAAPTEWGVSGLAALDMEAA